MKIRLVFTTLLLSMVTYIYGQEVIFSSDDFDYKVVNNDTKTVQLIVFDGTLKGDVTIPDSVTYDGITYAVGRIDNFGQNPDVISISIPKTVTSIPSLSGLTGLLNVYVDAENKNYKSIDGVLIQASNMSLSDYPRGRQGEFIIPEGVKQINTSFSNKVTKLTIPSTVNYISSYIAQYITEFVVATSNENFCSINGALYSKDGKTLIAYPATSASMITISSTVDSIGSYAFYGHSKSIILNRPTPPAIGKYNSSYSTNSYISGLYVKSDYFTTYQTDKNISAYKLYSYDFDKDSLLYCITQENEVVVNNSYKQSENVDIPKTVLDNNGNPYSVTAIGNRCFCQNYSLKRVTLPESLKAIGDSAFYDTYITSITFPESLETIGNRAFYSTDIKTVTLPASIKSIGEYAFYACYNLQSVFANGAPIDISNNCFYYHERLYVPTDYYNQYSTSIGWQDFSVIGSDLFDSGFIYRKLTDETVSIVKYVGDAKEIVIPDIVHINDKSYKVTNIDERAFYNVGLTSLTLPQYLTSIGDRAFMYNSLTEVILPDGLQVIGEYAFYNCGLKSLDIPSSIVRIGSYAFYYNSITSIYLKNRNFFEIGYGAIGDTYGTRIYISPISAVSSFKSAENWRDYYYLYGVDGINDDLGFKIISDTEAAVISCSKRFDSSTNMRSVAIPETVTIDDREYQVTTIADSAFYQSSANYFTIPATVDSIGLRAFWMYNNFTMVFEGETPAHINNETFYQWYSKVILVPPTVVDTYKETVGWQKVSNYIKANGTMIDGIIYKPLDDNRAVVDLAVAIPSSGILFLPKEVNIDDKNYQVAVIGQDAFNNNQPQYLVLPETIDSIYNPNYLGSTTYLQATVPPKVANSHTNRVIYVPSASKALYDSDPRWRYVYQSDDYIIGVDGMVDSLIYQKNVDGSATLMAWMKKINNREIIVPATITDKDDQEIVVRGLASKLFYNYSNISHLRLPATLNNVGQNALPSYVSVVTLDALVPPSIGTQDNISSSATLWVKGQSVQAYLDAEVWNKFKIRSEDEDSPLFSLRALDDENVEITGVVVDGLTTIVIPDTVLMNGKKMCVKSIGNGAFSKVSGLRTLVVSANLEKLGYKVFSSNRSYLNKIQVRAGNEHFMSRNNKMLLSKDGKTLVCVANYGINLQRTSFYENGRWTYRKESTIDGVETLAPGALDGYDPTSCYSYHSDDYLQQCLPLPASLKNITGEDLMYVQDLCNITVDTLSQTLCDIDGVLFSKDTTSIIRYPEYRYSYGKRSYELPSNVCRIEKFAFCYPIFESLSLSDSLKYIADSAFFQTDYYYSQIQSLILFNEEMAQATANSFTNYMYQNTVLYVPMGTQNDYLTTSPWSKFRNINSAKLAEEDFALLKAFYEEMGNGNGWYNKWTFGVTADETRIVRGIRMIDEHVYSIDLSSNGLTGSLSDKIFKLPRLEILNLSNNKLACPIDSVLNEENIDNSVLRELNISNNRLTGNIGAVGKTLKSLQTLNASYNKLSQVTPMLPTSIYDLSLYHQDMDTINYQDLFISNKEYVESGQPNLLFYDHSNRRYSSSRTFTLQNINGDDWKMQLSNTSTGMKASQYSNNYRLYNRPNGDQLKLSSNNDYNYAYIRMLFDPGDVNFDTTVDVSDLQLTINFALSEVASQLFNFTAADIQPDNWVNVQDVVSHVNILLDQQIASDNGNSNASRMSTSKEEDAEAILFWQGNRLILKTTCDVAAMDIAIGNAKDVHWLLNDVDYDYTIKKQKDYVRVIHYSLEGKEIKAGEVVIAEATGQDLNILKANLVRKDGRPVKTITRGIATSINLMSSDNTNIMFSSDINGVSIVTNQPLTDLRWSIYSIGGNLLGTGITDFLPGSYSLKCNLAGESQVIVRLTNEHINITKKVSIIK